MGQDLLNEWIEKAEEDFETAVTLVRKRRRPTPNNVCYHCQQCSEKYLKAFLIKHEIELRRIHDLSKLLDLCLPVDSSFSVITDLLDALEPYSTGFRYPGENASVEEAKEAVKIMKEVRLFIRKKLGLT